MKKILFAFTLLFLVGSLSFAQDKSKKTPEEKAASITKKLTEKLALNADQTSKVKAISLTKAQKLEQIKSKESADSKSKSAEFKVIKQQWESDLKAILTPSQFESYKKYKEEKKVKKKSNGTGKSNKGTSKAQEEEKDDDVD